MSRPQLGDAKAKSCTLVTEVDNPMNFSGLPPGQHEIKRLGKHTNVSKPPLQDMLLAKKTSSTIWHNPVTKVIRNSFGRWQTRNRRR